MNPPGFPGESVAAFKKVQNYDPALAKQLMDEAAPRRQGFPSSRSTPATPSRR